MNNSLPRKPTLLLLFILLVSLSLHSQSPQSTTLTLLATTDSHGHLLAWDYLAAKTVPYGLAKIATLIKEQRAAAPHALLLDCGDTTEGTPLLYYFAKKEPTRPNPAIAAFDALRYDAMAVGNHEFNFGLPYMWKAKKESQFPWLAANLKESYASADPGYIAPYIIREVDGVRVGIIGFVTPGVVRWELPENYKGYEFEPILDAARQIVPKVRAQSDLVVVIMHSGLDHDPDHPESGSALGDPRVENENAALQIAENVPGIDLIFYGHTHLEKPQLLVNGVLMAQAKNWGGSLARADIQMERDSPFHWSVVSKHSSTIRAEKDTPEDPEIVSLIQPYHQAAEKYLSTPISNSTETLEGATARYEESALVDAIQRAQLQAAHADVSMATLFNSSTTIHSGPVTIRDAFALYGYENILFAVEITGAQLKEALEHAAAMLAAWPFPEHQSISLPGYSFDYAEGVSYDIDLTRPDGHRVRNLTFRGAPLEPTQKLRLAINNYRYTGGGGYSVYESLPILWRSTEEMRDILIDYLTRQNNFPVQLENNWRIVPPEAQKAILDRAESENSARSH
jgi:2',3'-cyclic-nucleotide 2'-phosphodiesterase / 3'-nucleotidase